MQPLDTPPFPVLAHFAPHTRGLTWHRVPGGFSGAKVWRGDENLTPRIALKEWPAGFAPERLRQIHAWIGAARHLPFVPEAFGLVVHEGRVWDCCRWVPGELRLVPTAAEVASACTAVARLHDVWSDLALARGSCPGVWNRERILSENESLLRAGPNALPPVSAELDPLLRRVVEVVARLAPLLLAESQSWETCEFALHACVRDLRSEHVLFVDQKLTGIIDFGAAGVDHAAVDLARLLGDWASADNALFTAGLIAYRAARPTFDATDDFVRFLARSGAACSALGWVVRLVVRREIASDPAAIAGRLRLLLEHAERLSAA